MMRHNFKYCNVEIAVIGIERGATNDEAQLQIL